MSFKDYFNKATTIQALANKSAEEIGAEVESVGYHEQDIVREERFIPQVDYTLPGTFARYGLAEEYYSQSLKRIYDEYPYDGSLEERVKWENESTYLDLHIFDKEYPRTNGYILFSPSGWGSLDGSLTSDGYGLPTTVEHIALKGGPHPNPDGMIPYSTQFTGSNYYETAKNRENNLQYDLQNKGVSVEFWLKKAAFDTSKTWKEVIYDLYNGGTEETDDYGRLTVELSASGPAEEGADPFIVTLFSGNVGIATASVCPATLTTASVADNTWHHYAFTFMSASTSTGVDVNFYVDGNLSKTTALTTLDYGPDVTTHGLAVGLNEVTGALQARIGALITSPSGSSAAASAGKLSASLDEFRYWKTERTHKDVGRYWFTQVGGGTNDDPTPYVESTETINTNLGVYYKFNEGITGVTATDSVVLDFSGRITNGAWTGYTVASRSTGSAIVESSAAIKEFKDPIIYSFHPAVESLSTRLQISGSNYDVNNNASIYNTIPSWMVDEDLEGQSEIKHLTQILSSYFDTLHLQVESLSKIQNVDYVSGSSKPYPFADRRLASQGLFAPNLFLDADVLEKLADRSEDRLYEKSLTDIKNTIYQNIYNNLVYIYKSKGTEKAFRNMIRCFGIDDELVKLNAYAGNLEYDIRDNRRIVSVAEKFIDFNTADNSQATVFQFQDPGDTTNTSGYLPGNTELTGGYATTLEVDVLFPLKPDENSATYVDTNVISSSLFGVHGAVDNEADTSWDFVRDASNFQVYAARDEITSDNARFTLTGTYGGFVPELQSPLFEDVYNNTHWNLAVRIKPEQYPWAGSVTGYSDNYTVELHGVQLDAGIIQNEFTVSGTIASPAAGFVSGSKRVYVGAHKTNFTGTLLQASDVKIDACRYWLDYLDDKTLAGHAYDTQNYGSLNPHYYAFPFVSSSMTGEVLQADTMVFNWEFSNNTGSNASGQFRVADESSGSAANASTRFGWAGDLLSKQYTSLGYNFGESSTKAIDKDFILSSKLQLPENVQSSDMVNVLGQQDRDVFTRDSRPVNYFFAFEKSMAQAVSVEMINYFATLKDINNIIGAPVNRYRTEYKGLKILRQRFFERVSNDVIDFDKFYEFYKWFDTSLSTMIQQLIPASADFAENVRTLIESHVLERSKYQHKFQNVKQQLNTIEGTAVGSQQTGEMSQSPEDDPQGTGFYSMNAFSRRQLGSSQPINFKSWNLDHSPAALGLIGSQDYPGPAISLTLGDYTGIVTISSDGDSSEWNTLIGGIGALAKAYSVSFWFNPDEWVDSEPYMYGFGDGQRNLQVEGSNTDWTDGVLVASNNGAGTNHAKTVAGAITKEIWQHVVVTYTGGAAGTCAIYIDGADATDSTSTVGSPDKIDGANSVIGDIVALDQGYSGKMCDFAVWDAALSSAEVEEIYGAGGRVKLSTTSCEENLLSWYRMGGPLIGTAGAPVDTYDTIIYDQVGGRNGTPSGLGADDIGAASPSFTTPYGTAGSTERSKAIWWRSQAGRGLSALSSSDGPVNTNKQVMLNSIEKGNIRAQNSPYRFGAGGTRTLGGVGSAANKKVNFVFKATEPFGAGSNVAPENVIVGLGSGVEQLINTTDEYHPAFKQRLGFDMDPHANRGDADSESFDGNIIAPFSIYSSSLDSGANVLSNTYATGTIITNLHHDLVYDSDIPAQGPFTEQFVGGRQFRHTELNASSSRNPGLSGLASSDDRAEGWKIEFQGVSSSATTEYATPMLGIVAANYDATSSVFYNADIPTAHRLRNVGTKRPVNIQNIKMTTSSIGNYQKNYQVVQSNSRRKNDPYFNDQSFDFAPYPENDASVLPFSRNRKPLQNVRVANTIAVSINDDPDYYDATISSGLSTTMRANSAETWVAWVNLTALGSSEILWWGIPSAGNKGSYARFNWDGTLSYGAGHITTTGYWTTTNPAISAGTWTHIAITYNGSSISNDPVIYINGVSVAVTENTAPAGALSDYTGEWSLGVNAGTSFEGLVSDMAFYNTVLNSGEIAAIHGNGTLDLINYGPPRVADNLIMWWRMGNGQSAGGVADSAVKIYDLMENLDLDQVNSPSLETIDASACLVTANANNFALPDRTGANSNQTIIVNHFSSPGEYKTLSRGYLDPAHEELSVYNASPYRNRDVIDYGLSGSASVDPTETIVVVDQIDKNRGLDQRATLHCGPFGSDAAYGSVPASTYVTVPSWHKTNRNRRRRVEGEYSTFAPDDSPLTTQETVTASVYDNLYVQHQIPQSEQQYAWITASMAAGEVIYGLDAPSCISSSTMSQLITGSEMPAYAYYGGSYQQNFVGYNGRMVIDSTNSETHLQYANEYSPLDVGTYSGEFNGTTSNIDIGTASDWNTLIGDSGTSAKAFSVSAWVYMNSNAATGRLVNFGFTDRSLYWEATQPRLRFYIRGTTSGVIATSTLNNDQWYHVVATFEGGDDSIGTGNLKLYINGVEDTVIVTHGDVTAPYNISSGGCTIGAIEDSLGTVSQWVDGYLADVGVWADELNAAEVLTLYNNGRPIKPSDAPNQTDLKAWYRMSPWDGDTPSVLPNRDPSSPDTDLDGTGTDLELVRFSPNSVDGLNILTNNRNGPYGWPTWKQIRSGESAVARSLRKQNLIGQIVPPPTFETPTGFVQGLKANTFVDYIEQPVASNGKPVFFAFEDNDANPDVANNLAMNVSYQNNLDYFSNEGLNSRLGVNKRRLVNVGTAFNTVADFTLSASLSTVIRYGERIYPAKTNVYQTRTRTRDDYDITNIWNESRDQRSLALEVVLNSQGTYSEFASIWPLDANIFATTVASVAGLGGGAGELQNNYSRFTGSVADFPSQLSVTGAATYSMKFLAGMTSNTVNIAGGTPWTAAEDAGLSPYQPYIDYAENIRLVGKDMSIVPEFRISEHMNEYVTNQGSNFLTKLDNIFTLTGSAVASSAGENFYKLYSSTDFMKYFKVVDDELADKTNGGSQPIRRHSIELSCDALLQFLPYKGFYPAERTQELASLLSQSMVPLRVINAAGLVAGASAPRRALYEPLISPGILFNTIKSGIAVGSMVFLGQQDQNISSSLVNAFYSNLYEDNLNTPSFTICDLDASHGGGNLLGAYQSSSYLDAGATCFAQQVPFEAIRKPAAYLSLEALGGTTTDLPPHSATRAGLANNYIYDTGTVPGSSSLGELTYPTAAEIQSACISYPGEKSPLYRFAIDNFLCETVNFFQQPLKSYVSKPEEEFLSVKKDQYYGLKMILETSRKAASQSGGFGTPVTPTTVASGSLFGMYSNMQSFGPPTTYLGATTAGAAGTVGVASCEPWLPPYWFGHAAVNIIFKGPWNGKVSLSDILSDGNTSYEYDKVSQHNLVGQNLYDNQTQSPGIQQITSSVDVDKKLLVVPPDTNTQQARWLIQSKFETPVLNFYGVTAPDVVSGSSPGYWHHDPMQIRGMWHQYGNKLQGNEGITLSMVEMPEAYTSSRFGDIKVKSLAKIVGFVPTKKRIGDFAEAKRVEEAIVCVPFLTDKNERKFFDVNKDSQEYVTQLSLLNKYIFPPTFDFLTNETVDPIAFYAFEFSTDFSQDDLINIWQNLPPESNSEFQKKTATIKIQSLVDRLLDHDKDLQWMVFKVKRRAEKDYNVFTKKGLVDGLPIVQPAIESPYSYNWPYDYFSLVELIKIDEDVVYATEDLIPEDYEGTPVVPDLREFIPAPEEMTFAMMPRMAILNKSKGEEDTTPTLSTRKPRRSRKPKKPRRSKKKR